MVPGSLADVARGPAVALRPGVYILASSLRTELRAPSPVPVEASGRLTQGQQGRSMLLGPSPGPGAPAPPIPGRPCFQYRLPPGGGCEMGNESARPAAVSRAGEGAGCALLSCPPPPPRDHLHPCWGLLRAFSLLLPCCRRPRLGCGSGRVWGIHTCADPQHHMCSHSQALRFVQSHVVPGTVPPHPPSH